MGCAGHQADVLPDSNPSEKISSEGPSLIVMVVSIQFSSPVWLPQRTPTWMVCSAANDQAWERSIVLPGSKGVQSMSSAPSPQ